MDEQGRCKTVPLGKVRRQSGQQEGHGAVRAWLVDGIAASDAVPPFDALSPPAIDLTDLDSLAETLLFEPTTGPGRLVLDSATGWTEATVPNAGQVADAIEPLVVTLLAATDTQYC